MLPLTFDELSDLMLLSLTGYTDLLPDLIIVLPAGTD